MINMQMNPSVIVTLTLNGDNHHHQSTSIDPLCWSAETLYWMIRPLASRSLQSSEVIKRQANCKAITIWKEISGSKCTRCTRVKTIEGYTTHLRITFFAKAACPLRGARWSPFQAEDPQRTGKEARKHLLGQTPMADLESFKEQWHKMQLEKMIAEKQ